MPMKNKLKDLLDSRSITRYEFTKTTKLNKNTVYRLYNEPEYIPSAQVLTTLCDALEVQPGEVLEWVKKQQES